jgi:hypothetical protein
MTGFATLPRFELGVTDSPFDEAVILIDGHEEEAITIECPGAAELAERLARYVNAHERVMQTLVVAGEVLRRFGAGRAAAEIEEISREIGAAA